MWSWCFHKFSIILEEIFSSTFQLEQFLEEEEFFVSISSVSSFEYY